MVIRGRLLAAAVMRAKRFPFGREVHWGILGAVAPKTPQRTGFVYQGLRSRSCAQGGFHRSGRRVGEL